MILARKIASDQNKPPATLGRLLGNRMDNQLVKNFSLFFCGTLNFIIALQFSLTGFCLRPDMSIPHNFTPELPLCTVFKPKPDYSELSHFASEFKKKKRISRHSRACNIIRPSNPPWFHHMNYIRCRVKVMKLFTKQNFLFFLPI